MVICRKINLNLVLFFCYDFNKVLYNSVITFIRLELYKIQKLLYIIIFSYFIPYCNTIMPISLK